MQQPFKDELLFSAFYTLFKRKWLVLGSFVAVFAVIFFMAALMTPRYAGTAKVLVDLNPRTQVVLFPEFTQPSGRLPTVDPTNNLIEMLVNRKMALEIVDRFELDVLLKDRRTAPKAMRDKVKKTLSSIAGGIGGLFGGSEAEKNAAWWRNEAATEFLEDWNRIEVERDTSVINVTIYGTEPQLAVEIARFMADRLGDLVREHAREKFTRMESFVAANRAAAEERLGTASSALEAFLEKEDPAFAEKEQDLLLAKRDSLQTLRIEADSVRTGTEQRLAELRRQLEDQDIRIETREEVETRNPAVTQMKAELQRLETQMAGLALDLQEDHPARRELAEKIRATREGLELEVAEDFQSRTISEEFNPLYVQTVLQIADALAASAAADARTSALGSLQTATEQRLVALGGRIAGLESRRADLDREVRAAESHFMKIRERASELEALAGSPEGEFDLRTIDPAHNPDGTEATTPVWDLVLPVAFIVAVFVALFLAFFLEYWRNTYRAPWELEAESGVEVLATVPRIGKVKN